MAGALALITCRPAGILGIPAGTLGVGAPADLTLFDPDEEWVVDESGLHSKSKNSPFLGRRLVGKVKHTVVDGDVVTTRLHEDE